MTSKSVLVLLICKFSEYYEIKKILIDAKLDTCFNLYWVSSLSEGLRILNNHETDVALLGLEIFDINEINVLKLIKIHKTKVPIVVLVESSNAAVTTDAVQSGIQVKQETNSNALARSLLYAIARQRMINELHTAALFDELTGLYNRRGFMNLARDYVEVAEHTRQGMLLLYADLDNLKCINDNFGHCIGNQTIATTALMLKNTFRSSDIIARIGGDEFIVLVANTDLSQELNILARLRENSQFYLLSLSVGFAYYDPDMPCTIEELIDKADKNMYIAGQ